MTIAQLLGALQLGLLYGLLGIGLYIPFRVLDIPDMTTQGSFTLGMAVAGVLTFSGHPILGLIAAALAGALAGVITGVLHTKFKIASILAGILTMTGLYTANLMIMGGKANISLIGKETIFTMVNASLNNEVATLTTVSLVVTVITVVILAVFFHTRMGLTIRATGDNDAMVRHTSINTDVMKIIGLAIGNGLAALSGALICHYNLFADVNSGTGILVVGLASIIIGETMLKRGSVTRGLIATVFGSVLYRLIIALALKFDILPSYGLNLVSTLIVIIALMTPTVRQWIAYRQKRVRHKSLVQKWMKEEEEAQND